MFAPTNLVITTSSSVAPHGGPVMNFAISLHFIYYGSWGETDEEVVITKFVGANIASTQYYAITKCLEDQQGNPVASSVDLPDWSISNYIKGFEKTITDATQGLALVQKLVSNAGLGLDPNDIYVVFGHDDVTVPFLCNDACGMHSYWNESVGPIKYILIGGGGDVNTCDACALTVNGPWGGFTNQLVNSFVHQLINTVSDPLPFTGWADSNDVEAASKCTNNFVGAIPFLPNKAKLWNVVIASNTEKHWFLLQGNWDITANACRTYPLSNCQIIAPTAPVTSAAHNPSSAIMLNAGLSIVVSSVFAFFFLF